MLSFAFSRCENQLSPIFQQGIPYLILPNQIFYLGDGDISHDWYFGDFSLPLYIWYDIPRIVTRLSGVFSVGRVPFSDYV